MNSRAPQGGFQDWANLRSHLIDAYGSTPHPATEQEIIDAYQLHPAAIEKAALALIDQPDVQSPWGVLKSRAGKISTPPSNPTRSTGLDREKRIARAEQWIRTAGIHFDRESEILDELFGDRGILEPYANDEVLQIRFADLWTQHRPRGEQLERDAEAAGQKWKAQHAVRMEQARALATPSTHDDIVP